MVLQPSTVDTLAAMPRTFAPGTAFLIAATAPSTLACVRPLSVTSAPAAANPFATA